jgi:hypothetical protein
MDIKELLEAMTKKFNDSQEANVILMAENKSKFEALDVNMRILKNLQMLKKLKN